MRTHLQLFSTSLTRYARPFYWLAGIESWTYTRIVAVDASNDAFGRPAA